MLRQTFMSLNVIIQILAPAKYLKLSWLLWKFLSLLTYSILLLKFSSLVRNLMMKVAFILYNIIFQHNLIPCQYSLVVIIFTQIDHFTAKLFLLRSGYELIDANLNILFFYLFLHLFCLRFWFLYILAFLFVHFVIFFFSFFHSCFSYIFLSLSFSFIQSFFRFLFQFLFLSRLFISFVAKMPLFCLCLSCNPASLFIFFVSFESVCSRRKKIK